MSSLIEHGLKNIYFKVYCFYGDMSNIMTLTPLNLSVQALKLLLYCALPVLLANIVVGVFMAVVQAITHIQDSSLSFVPKAIITAVVFFLFHDRMFQAFQIFFHNVMRYIAIY